MGDFQQKASATSLEPGQETEQPSLVVGKIRKDEGLWGALEQITTCDVVRNGVLVVFSQEASGRLGVFCNRYITGAVIDSSSELGVKAIKTLLGIKNGMFCFRPCLVDETKELGQKISISIKEVLELKNDSAERPENPAETLQRIKLHQMETAVNDDFLSDIADQPVESALVITGGHSLTEIDDKPAGKPDGGQQKPAQPGQEQPPKDDDGSVDYLGWMEKQNKDDNSPNLRKILLPALKQPSAKEGQKDQVARDLEVYRKVLQQEESKVRNDIQKNLERGTQDANAQQALQDMQMLAGLLHSQEEMIQKRWQGLDEIPTPRNNSATHIDAYGATKPGAPVRARQEYMAGCEDLISQTTRITDPREFIKKRSEDTENFSINWATNPKVLAVGIIVLFGVIIMALAWYLNGTAVRACLIEGKDAIKAERWSDAIVALNSALDKDRFNGQAYFYRGIAYEETGEAVRAQSDFKAAREHGVPAADIAVAQAGIEFRREQWQRAVELCDQAIIAREQPAQVYRLRANANMRLGAFQEAITDCDNALKQAKNDPALTAQIMADRGYAKIQIKDFAGGSADFDVALKDNPEQGLYMLKADACRNVKRYADAIANYSKALDLDPKNYDCYVARGMSEAALHQKDAALKDFGRALQINSNGVEALIQRGSLLLASGDGKGAVEDLSDAWNLNPTVYETREKLMKAYAIVQKTAPRAASEQMIKDAEPSRLHKLPSDPRQLVIVGYSLMEQGDLDGAIECLVQAVKKQPNNGNARRYLAHAFGRCGEFGSALAQFKVLASIDRLTDEDAVLYGEALEQSGDNAQAVAILTRSLATSPDNVPLRVKLAEAYYHEGNVHQGDDIAQAGLMRAVTSNDRQQLLDVMRNGGSAGAGGGSQQVRMKTGTGMHG